MLAIGAALLGSLAVLGVDIDADALEVAQQNCEQFEDPLPVSTASSGPPRSMQDKPAACLLLLAAGSFHCNDSNSAVAAVDLWDVAGSWQLYTATCLSSWQCTLLQLQLMQLPLLHPFFAADRLCDVQCGPPAATTPPTA
jgi:hypothetical protein